MIKCKHADKYKAIYKPKCGCEVCELKWELRLKEDIIQMFSKDIATLRNTVEEVHQLVEDENGEY